MKGTISRTSISLNYLVNQQIYVRWNKKKHIYELYFDNKRFILGFTDYIIGTFERHGTLIFTRSILKMGKL